MGIAVSDDCPVYECVERDYAAYLKRTDAAMKRIHIMASDLFVAADVKDPAQRHMIALAAKIINEVNSAIEDRKA